MVMNFKAQEKRGRASSGLRVGALLCTTALALTLPAGASWAQSVSWNNGGTGDWTSGANWSAGNPPTAAEAAYFFNGGTAEINSGTSAEALVLGLGSSSGTSGNLIIQAGGDLALSGGLAVGNNGVAVLSLLDIAGGTLVQNGGASWIYDTGRLVLRNGGVIDVSGNGNGGVLGLSGGTLVIGDGGGNVLATGIWSLSTPGQVIFDNSDDSIFSTQIEDNIDVVHDGAGTTTLSGNNTYTGGTTLNAGIVSVSQNNNLGAASGTLTFDGGTLQTTAGFSMNRATTIGAGGGTFDVIAGTLTQSGVMSGNGQLGKTGAGTLTLTGNSSAFAGTTIVDQGTLVLENLLGGSKSVRQTGTLDLRVANSVIGETVKVEDWGVVNLSVTGAGNGAIFDLDDNAIVNILANNALSATSTVYFTDRDTKLRLNGYSTTVGRLTVSNDERGIITNEGSSQNAVLTVVGQPGNSSFTGTIEDGSGSGTLGLTLEGGTLDLWGPNTYTGGTTINGGTLLAIRAGAFVDNTAYAVNGGTLDLGGFDLTMSSLSGTGGTVSLGAANLTVNQAANTTYAGVLTGTGDFSKSGTGTLTLIGDSSAFSGTTSVGSGGALVVGVGGSGALGGALTIGAGSRLGGTGAIGAAGLTTAIAAGATHAPGNSVGVQHIAGDYVNNGTLEIEATPVAADQLVVAGAVDITGATLELVLSPTDAASWNVFNGPFIIIDKQSAGAVVGTFNPINSNLLFLDTILDYAGGDGNDVTLELRRNDIAFASAGTTRNQIATGAAIDALGAGNPLWQATALTTDPDLVRASFDALSGEVHASVKTALIDDSRFLRSAVNERIRAAFDGVDGADDPAFWSQAFGSWVHIDGDGNAARLVRSTGGFLFGADAPLFDTWRLGVVAGYSNTSFDAKDRHSSGSSDNYHLGLYGGAQWGDLSLRTGAAYTLHDISTSRIVAVPGISDSLSGNYNAGTAQVFGEFGYRMQVDNVAFEPFANLAYVRLHNDGFTERGGAAALTGMSADADVAFATLGLRTTATFDLNGINLTAKGMIGWRHAIGEGTPESAMRFAGGSTFDIAGAPIARDAAAIEASLDLAISSNATLGAAYGGQFSSGLADQSFGAHLKVSF